MLYLFFNSNNYLTKSSTSTTASSTSSSYSNNVNIDSTTSTSTNLPNQLQNNVYQVEVASTGKDI